MPGNIVGTPGRLSFDIFCRVIDNYGDIGVCWRLARQLARPPFSLTTRLWVDDLHRFSRLESDLDPTHDRQTLSGVDIIHWQDKVPRLTPHDVVIEAFACTPPADFIDAMAARDSLWLNLEYLSAEDWVEDFHLQPSIQANGVRKFFFFPGFTDATGGLLREDGLIEKRNRWQSVPENRTVLLKRCGLSPEDIRIAMEGGRLIFLFCYPDAPVSALIDALSTQATPSLILIPDGLKFDEVAMGSALSKCVARKQAAHSNHVRICRIPFVDQDDFDKLLWSCDLNIVRGEDSLVRALWASRPMIWQPYRQDDNLHIIKLDAWLARSGLHPNTQMLIRSWTTGDSRQFCDMFSKHQESDAWHRWEIQSKTWSEQLASQTDLTSALVQFCTQQR